MQIPIGMRTKVLVPLSIILSSITFPLMAQDPPPTVSITAVALDEGASTVQITFDLIDPGNSPCEILFRASMDEGVTFIETANVSGDIGTGIAPGNNKSLIWNYGALANIHAATIEVIAINDVVPDIQNMVDQVDQQQLMDRLQSIAIPRHHTSAPQGSQQVRDTIHDTFEQLGLQTTVHVANFSGAQADNVLGRHVGAIDPIKTFIVDGHYDAVAGTPGADDNGTAVAATLEIARVLSQYRFRNSLRFIGFSFEEQGVIGSQQYVQNGMPAWEEVHGVLNMEMIGYYSDQPGSQTTPDGFELLFPAAHAELQANEFRGDFLTVVGNTASDPLNNIFVSAIDQYVPLLERIPLSVPGNGQIAPDLRRSDHAPFWDAGIPALMLTDGSNFRNPNYHLPTDDISTIDPVFFTNSTKAVLAAAAMLAEPINAGSDRRSLAEFVGVHEHHATFPCSVEVHPNPATDRISIRLGGCNNERVIAELFDLKGNRLAGKELIASAEDHQFDLSRIGAGLYLLVLKAGESSATVKVEVQR